MMCVHARVHACRGQGCVHTRVFVCVCTCTCTRTGDEDEGGGKDVHTRVCVNKKWTGGMEGAPHSKNI
jgi:hypothetical protein